MSFHDSGSARHGGTDTPTVSSFMKAATAGSTLGFPNRKGSKGCHRLDITPTLGSRVDVYSMIIPKSKVHGAIMGPTWGQQDPGGPDVGPMNFALWDALVIKLVTMQVSQDVKGLQCLHGNVCKHNMVLLIISFCECIGLCSNGIQQYYIERYQKT